MPVCRTSSLNNSTCRTPDIHLEVGSGSHAGQTARVLERMEEVLLAGPKCPQGNGAQGKGADKEKPFDQLLVVGDVNSTLASTLAAAKLNIPVAHVEAGLRSRDRTMPEEVNRLMTDAVADLLLVSEPEGVDNLRAEGHPESRIHLVGNVMIDTLLSQLECSSVIKRTRTPGDFGRSIRRSHATPAVECRSPRSSREISRGADRFIDPSAGSVFPIHPRTAAKLTDFGLMEKLQQSSNIHCLPSIGYREFLCFTSQAKVIVTDSGGLQEESTALGIPCLTMRSNTERPITVTEGTSTLIGRRRQTAKRAARSGTQMAATSRATAPSCGMARRASGLLRFWPLVSA